MLSIHLRRTGAKKDAHYRVVVTDSRAARDGAFIEILGHYHPRYEPAKVVLDVEKTKAWIQKGAQPSDTVKSLMKKVESGAVETENPVAPSRRRESVKQAKTRAAAPAPEPEVEPDVEPTPADEAGGETAEATTDEPAVEAAADAVADDAGAATESAAAASDDAGADVAEQSSDDAAAVEEGRDAETAAEEDDEQAKE